jgi:hypothetical protein
MFVGGLGRGAQRHPAGLDVPEVVVISHPRESAWQLAS